MANSDKNIKITPNISQTAQPNVVFTGQGNVPITLKVLDDSYGTLSFEGSAGQLFSINNNLTTGVIFSVNDVSGIPQIDVNADGTIRLAPFAYNVQIAGLTAGKGGGGVSTNTAFGLNALGSNTTQGGNTAFGSGALGNTSTASSVTAVGYNAGYGSSGSEGVVIGSATLGSGNRNVVVGSSASASTSGNYNVAVGAVSGYSMTSGSRNVSIGYYALYGVTTTGENVAVGADAGRYRLPFDYVAAVGMSNSVYIGSYAYANSNETNAIAIGYGAASKGSNNTVIGNTSTTTSTIFGETQYIGGVAGTAVSIQPQTRSTSGAGANMTIAAGSGVTSGAGGSVILQPGAQASTGGNGTITFNNTSGTAVCKFSTDSSALTVTVQSGMSFALKNSTGTTVLSVSSAYLGLGADLDCGSQALRNVGSIFASGYAQCTVINPKLQFPSNVPTAAIENGSTGQIKVTDASTGGGSFAFTSSSPSAYTTNQNDLVLTGSAFQRLSGTAARDITGVAPPSGGSHVDGRMIRIYNIGSFNLTLKHNSTSSTAANRFFCVQSADIVIATNDFAELIYDSTNNGSGAAGWRVA